MKLLLPTDGSTYSRNAAKVAGRIATKHNAEIVIVHVVEDKGLGRKTWRETGAGQVISSIKEELISMGCEESKIHAEIVDGNAPEKIVKTARMHKVDRIIIGTRGQTGIKKIMGSVTQKVLQMSDILVLVVPPDYKI
ncbi:universal stress protein [Methanococcoides sp. AM1]|uniref:universal stress protein n=1 Tax=Methanococcoides sp. AM1 TaxID=1201011 RepID=UPI0010834625|nr:universal stress protein [Methanococcoides sp. AM1]